MPDPRKLLQFFCARYAKTQLKLLFFNIDPSHPVLQLNWDRALEDVAFDIVGLLARQAMLDDTLREALLTDLPALGSEIEAIWEDGGAQSDRVALPVVTFAMTRQEVETLPDEVLLRVTTQVGVDVRSRYGAGRDDWRPSMDPSKTIRGLIADAADSYKLRIAPSVDPSFESDVYFGEDAKKRIDKWNEIGDSCFLLVLDPISLFHHGLLQRLLQSGAHSKQQVIMVAFPVVPPLKVRQEVEDVLRDQLQQAYSAFERFDPLKELGIANEQAFQRWLFSIFPKAADLRSRRVANEQNQNRMRRLGSKRGMSPSGVR